MNIKIYAPCNGFAKPIEELKDGVFSNFLLGKGVYFEPAEDNFTSICDEGKILQVADTKHAIFFEVKNIKEPILMHIGLDTVKLNGSPFDLKVRPQQQVSLKDHIIDVNLKEIKENKMKVSTPIVLDCKDLYEVVNIRSGNVSRGDILFEIQELKDQNKIVDENKPVEFVGKYDKVAEIIYNAVGTNKNFRTYHNCMTRLRFFVKNKKEVQIDDIKKIEIVKGINWAGDELQIIIGGEVYKVKDAIDYYVQKKINFGVLSNKKTKFSTECLNLIKGVVLPLIPVLIAASILQALYIILSDQVCHLFPVIDANQKITSYSWINVMLYIIAYPGTQFLAIFFLYGVVKYLKGNTYMGLLMGVILISPYLYPNLQITWFVLKIGSVSSNIGIKSYPTSVIPMVAAGIAYVFLDRWIKTWMPTSVDLVFRHFLAVLLSCVATFILFGNILGMIEVFIGYLVALLDYIPFGISTAVFSILWQPLVLTGTHAALINTIIIPALSGQSVPIMFGAVFGAFGQLGAAIGVAIKTKNSNTRSAAIASIPAGFFNITEPILYGVTLRNGKTFIIGCLCSGIGGIIYTGFFNGQWYMPLGLGIFSVFSVGHETKQYIGWVIANIAIILSPAILVVLLWKERVDELDKTKKINNKIIKIVSSITNEKPKELLQKYILDIEPIIKTAKELKVNSKSWETCIRRSIKSSLKLNNKVSLTNKKKEKLALVSQKLFKKDKIFEMKGINLKFYELDNSTNIEKLELEQDNCQIAMHDVLNKLEVFQTKYINYCKQFINKLVKDTNNKNIELFINNYYNTIHSLDIAYEISDKKTDIYIKEKKEVLNEKNKIS